MNRRNAVYFAFALLPATVPLIATGQQGRRRTIGYLVQSPLTEPPSGERLAFLDELTKLGQVLGKNVLIEYRSAENTPDFLPDLAQELVKLDVDVMVVTGGAAAAAAKSATSRIPIVLTQHSDPVGQGLVQSLSRPGGNITGMSSVSPDLAGKRLQLLREIIPGARKVAVLYGGYAVTLPREIEISKHRALSLNLSIQAHPVESADSVVRWFDKMGRNRPDVVMVLPDVKTVSYRDVLVEQASRHHLPLVAGWPDLTRAGALYSYSADFIDMFRRSAHFVDKILRGAKPSDLPIEQPTRFSLLLNMKAARDLRLTIPQSIALRADEVIQ